MRRNSTIEAIWNSGQFIGTRRASYRVTVNRTWTLQELASTAYYTRGGRRAPVRSYLNGVDIDIPPQNILRIRSDRDLASDTATCTITILNTAPTGGPNPAKQGMFSQRRTINGAPPGGAPAHWPVLYGDDAIWGSVEGGALNHSYGLIAQGNMVKTYEGYAGENMKTGVWIIDQVTYTHDGNIDVVCRDVGALLIDQQLYASSNDDVRGLVPQASYPTQFYSPTWNQEENGDAEGKIPTSTNYDDWCCDALTEIFTSRGWLKHYEVKVGDRTLAIDPVTWRSEWVDVLHVYERDGVHDMIRMSGTTHDSFVTENHKWLVESRYGNRTFKLARDLNTDSAIPIAAPRADAPTVEVEADAMVEVVGWFWTEGYIRRLPDSDRIEFSQSQVVNPEHVARIDRAVEELYGPPGRLPRRSGLTNEMAASSKALFDEGWSVNAICNQIGISDVTFNRWKADDFAPGYGRWSRLVRPNGVVIWTFDEIASREVLDRAPDKVMDPEFLQRLTQRQLDLLIDVSMAADGHTKASGTRILSQVSEERIDAFTYLCCLAGLATSVSHSPAAEGRSPKWTATICKRTKVRPLASARQAGARRTVTRERYEGTVWCPSTKHRNWLARRNGTVYFTGNCDIVKILVAWSGFSTPDGNDVLGIYEQTGSHSSSVLGADLFDKKQPIDPIKMIRDIVGYTTFVNQDGGFQFTKGNQWKAGNLVGGAHTSAVFDIDEAHQLIAYTASGTKLVDRGAFIACEQDPFKRGATAAEPYPRYASFDTNTGDPNTTYGTKNQLHGMKSIALIPVDSRVSFSEMVTMAELTGLRAWFMRRRGQVTIPGNPCIELDDQVRIFERVTYDHFLHHVSAISSDHDCVTGEYKMTLTTHWMGPDNASWEIMVSPDGHVYYNTSPGGAGAGASTEFSETPVFEGELP